MKRIPSKKPNSAPLRTQGGSFIQVPATLDTHCTDPLHAPTRFLVNPQGKTILWEESQLSNTRDSRWLFYTRNQAPRAHAPQPSTQGTQALSALAPEPTTQPSIETKELTVKDVWELPSNERIVLEWNGEGQPVGDSGGLLTKFLGPIGRDFSYFPISYENWKKVPRDYKRIAYENDIEEIGGKFDIHFDLQKSYVFKSLGLRWREHGQDLWHARDNNTRTRDELISMVPEGLNAQKNKENRKKQTIPHTTGSKSLARRRAEMEKEFGRNVSRGEVWTATHKQPVEHL
ncbi:putative transposase, Ptta/En/Spm, plant [Sesbania bispinosa]|nr:putative transposase, Ptta/En/Spm, plant [Sesbania bispinosa]